MKKSKSLSDQTLTKILSQQIKPIPKWKFILKNFSLWIVLVISILIGAIAFSVLIYMFKNNDWDLYYFPYFWLFSTSSFIIFAYLIFSKTRKAYRFQLRKIVIFEMIVSLILGSIFSFFNLGVKIDTLLAQDIPAYRQIAPMKMQVWNNPSAGRLSGTITKVLTSTQFELTDFNNHIWTINSKNALIRHQVEIQVGQEIKLLGAIEKNIFTTSEIRPWAGQIQIERKRLTPMY